MTPSLLLTWGKPTCDGRMGNIVMYKVEALKVQLKNPDSKELESVPLTPPYDVVVEDEQTQITEGLGL